MNNRKMFADGGIDIPETKGDRKLVWGDCFNADKLDTEFWEPKALCNGSDIERYIAEDTCVLKNGSVYLTSYKKEDGTGYVTPLFLTTFGKMEFRYGYFEIKAQVPFYKGNSSAFWFCSTDKTEKGNKCETDMVELLGREDNVVSNLHIWGPENYHTSFDGKIKREDRSRTFDRTPEELRKETHTYFMDWTPDYIDFGVDGEVYYRADLSDNGKKAFRDESADMDTFRLPVYPIISEYLYTPGRKLGWGLDGTEDPFSYVMKLDHVALYQKNGEDIISK